MILINGKAAETVPATDRALHYGDGLFETIAVLNGKPQLWQQHMARLVSGCKRLGIPAPDESTLFSEAQQVIADAERAVLKIIISRGSGGRGYRPPEQAEPVRLLFRYPWPAYGEISSGIRLRLCSTPLGCNPALAGLKHLNRLEHVIARAEWTDASIQEGLMCDLDGHVIEGTMSNLFVVINGELYTPALDRCGVAGVMRHEVLEVARQQGLGVVERAIQPAEIEQADELFVTNSLIGIWPVVRFESVEYGDNPLTRQLNRVLQAHLERE